MTSDADAVACWCGHPATEHYNDGEGHDWCGGGSRLGCFTDKDDIADALALHKFGEWPDSLVLDALIAKVRESAEAERDAALAMVARAEEALIWCSGSSEFAESGIAREGWVRLVQPLLDDIRAAATALTQPKEGTS